VSRGSKFGHTKGYCANSTSGMQVHVEGVGGVFLAYEDYDLLREVAEEWSRDCVEKDMYTLDVATLCSECGNGVEGPHATDCKAARILGLKREMA